MDLSLGSEFLVNDKKHIVIGFYPFMEKMVCTAGPIDTGEVFEFTVAVEGNPYCASSAKLPENLVLTPAVWNDSAIANRPGVGIDNFHCGRNGRVRVEQHGSCFYLKVKIAPNGVVFQV